MKKLKTLNDLIDMKQSFYYATDKNQIIVNDIEVDYNTKVIVEKQVYNRLKQTAIEWIKELKNSLRFDEDDGYIIDSPFRYNGLFLFESWEDSDITGAIEWIKYFFNISDEELK